MSTAIDYAAVVADLRFRAGRLNEAAAILEGMMGEEEKPVVAAPVAAAPPVAAKTRKKARNFEEFLDRKKAKAGVAVADNRPTLIGTLLTAITEGPKNPADLTARVLQLRPGTDVGEIPKTAYALKLRGKIEKRLGKWHLVADETQPEAAPVTAPEPKPKSPPAVQEPSIRDLIRQAIAKGPNTTMEDIVERVQRARPSLPPANIKTAVSQLIIGGEAKQTFGGVIEGVNLKMPAAANGAAH